MNVQYILFSFRDVLFCTADVEGIYCCLSTLKSSAYFSPANFTGSARRALEIPASSHSGDMTDQYESLGH